MNENLIVGSEKKDEPVIPQYILYHSILAGLTPLIPIPFLDDWLKAQIHRRLLAQVLKKHNVDAVSGVPRIIEDGQRTFKGCILSVIFLPFILLKMLVVKLLFKMIKKITVILTINDCCNVVSEVFHSAYLLDYALAKWDGTMTEDQADELHSRITQTLKHVDTRLFQRQIKDAFRERRALARRARISMRLLARRLWRNRRLTKSEPAEIEDTSGALQKLLDALQLSLSKMDGYFDGVKTEYDRQAQTI